MFLEDKKNHLHQQRKANLFVRISTFYDTLGSKTEKMNCTLQSHLLLSQRKEYRKWKKKTANIPQHNGWSGHNMN